MFASSIPIHPEVFPRLIPRDGLQVREDSLYTNHKGEEKSGIRKRVDKALKLLGEALQKVLEPQEVILYIAAARREAGALEQLTMGWAAAQAVTMTTLVFTNQRLLAFRVKRDGRLAQWRAEADVPQRQQGEVLGALVGRSPQDPRAGGRAAACQPARHERGAGHAFALSPVPRRARGPGLQLLRLRSQL
jgi:hypothetical protein